MRRAVLITLGGLLMTGCAASPSPTSTATTEHQYIRTAVPVLAFDAPIGAQSLPALSRDDRGVSAFGGFPNLTAEYYDVQTDDDQLYYDYPSTYERRVQSDRVGVIFR